MNQDCLYLLMMLLQTLLLLPTIEGGDGTTACTAVYYPHSRSARLVCHLSVEDPKEFSIRYCNKSKCQDAISCNDISNGKPLCSTTDGFKGMTCLRGVRKKEMDCHLNGASSHHSGSYTCHALPDSGTPQPCFLNVTDKDGAAFPVAVIALVGLFVIVIVITGWICRKKWYFDAPAATVWDTPKMRAEPNKYAEDVVSLAMMLTPVRIPKDVAADATKPLTGNAPSDDAGQGQDPLPIAPIDGTPRKDEENVPGPNSPGGTTLLTNNPQLIAEQDPSSSGTDRVNDEYVAQALSKIADTESIIKKNNTGPKQGQASGSQGTDWHSLVEIAKRPIICTGKVNFYVSDAAMLDTSGASMSKDHEMISNENLKGGDIEEADIQGACSTSTKKMISNKNPKGGDIEEADFQGACSTSTKKMISKKSKRRRH
ncbi:uncharacterized protein LOC143282551 [Babylonia areolata]|uniref:uncharacterized protein LOC143282551 n=1 Tax=Babylonia areolata TaxID=304850 RepID=UPI003FD25456